VLGADRRHAGQTVAWILHCHSFAETPALHASPAFSVLQNGESGADVYDRITIFQDHLIYDIETGKWFLGGPTHTSGIVARAGSMSWE
jgi:hypothetical protein